MRIHFMIFLIRALSVVTIVESFRFVEEKFQKPYLQVQTKTGFVQGTRMKSEAEENGFYFAYLGIPYAKPPIGYLRFRSPQWAENWPGVLDASIQGSNCIEFHPRLRRSFYIDGNEDCLFINVFTKKNPRRAKQLSPVMVFFHGGAFFEGSSDILTYGPDFLVKTGVVVVTLNYRIGLFGFLSTEDSASPGNYGLKDQNLALRWVQKNIQNFGGDPGSVTIFGQSAGSVSVNFHLLSPKSRGLFHRAILESGSVLCHWGSRKQSRNIAYLIGIANGITNPKNSEDLIESLRKIDIEQMKDTSLGPLLFGFSTATLLGLPFSPTMEPEHEDAFISKDFWYEMMKNGEFNKVPILMGMNANESLFFYNVVKTIQPFLITYDIDQSFPTPPAMNITNYEKRLNVGKIVTNRYLTPYKFLNSNLKTILKFTDADYFSRPIHKTALLMGKHTPVYFYYFSHQGDLGYYGIDVEARTRDLQGVRHGEELFYILNRFGNKSKSEIDRLVRKRMLNIWSNFAKFGNPTPSRSKLLNDITWPLVSPIDKNRFEFLEINETLTLRNGLDNQDDLDWWEDMFERFGEPPFRTY